MLPVRPTSPTVSPSGTLAESTTVSTVATCSSSGFRPSTIVVTWQLQGGAAVPASSPNVSPSDSTFTMTSEYVRALSRSDNGKMLTCTVNHTTLSTPRAGSVQLDVKCKYI